MSKKKILLSIIVISACLISLFIIPQSRVKILELKYDYTHQNNRIEEKNDIKKILNSFSTIKYKNLDKKYLKWSKSDIKKYKNILKYSNYKIITQDDFFKKIVRDFRIKDFICKDSIYRKCLFNSKQEYYWLIDEKLLFAVLKLQTTLKKKGYNPDAFNITYGHRHPKKNEDVKGASVSKHIKGQAIDMVIKDINNDGKYTKKDKEIVLEISEKDVIKNFGGIGRYPETRTVHIDVRGVRARWDSY